MSLKHNLTPKSQTKVISTGVAAGTTDTQTFTEFDMQGFQSFRVIAQLGTVTSTGVATLNAKNSDTSATYGAGTIDNLHSAGIVGTTGDSNKLLIFECHRPPKRYVRAQIVRATANVAITSVIVELFNPIAAPAAAGSEVAAGTLVINDPTASLT